MRRCFPLLVVICALENWQISIFILIGQLGFISITIWCNFDLFYASLCSIRREIKLVMSYKWSQNAKNWQNIVYYVRGLWFRRSTYSRSFSGWQRNIIMCCTLRSLRRIFNARCFSLLAVICALEKWKMSIFIHNIQLGIISIIMWCIYGLFHVYLCSIRREVKTFMSEKFHKMQKTGKI